MVFCYCIVLYLQDRFFNVKKENAVKFFLVKFTEGTYFNRTWKLVLIYCIVLYLKATLLMSK
jgi:hypothetical protein